MCMFCSKLITVAVITNQICYLQTCNGTGTEVRIKQLGPGMIQQMQTRCSNCGGAGYAPPKGERELCTPGHL